MSHVSRREFLKGSIAAGLSFSAACSTGKKSSYSRIIGANDEIRIGVVGFRSKGAQHIRVFHELPNVSIVALCDVDQNILGREAQKFIDRNEKIDTYRDVRKLLEDKNIDAIVIATPSHWHSLIAIWACQAGKDIYVEKPVSHNVWEGRKLVEAARKYSRIVQAGTQNRSDVGFREAVQFIREGNLGKVLWAHGLWYKNRGSIGKVDGPQPIPEGIDYDLWIGPATMQPLMRKALHYDWHWFWDYGNGDMGNLGVHQIDDCRFALDLTGYPQRIISYGGRYVYDDDAETPNTQVAIYEYKEAPIIIEVRNLPRAAGQKAMDHLQGVRAGNIIMCENGYFAGGRGGGWTYDKDGQKLKQFPGDGGGLHQANFIKAMRSGKSSDLHADVLQGHISSALCHAANITYRLGKHAQKSRIQFNNFRQAEETYERIKTHLQMNEVDLNTAPITMGPWLTFDEKQEKFTGDLASEANKWLGRDYRDPFVVPDKV